MPKVKYYQNRRGDYPVRDFIEQLDTESQGKAYGYITLLQEEGHRLGRPYVGKATGEIWYLRPKTKAGHIRIFYFFFKRHPILLHSFKKKTQKIPKREIKTAEDRIEDFRLRYERGELK